MPDLKLVRLPVVGADEATEKPSCTVLHRARTVKSVLYISTSVHNTNALLAVLTPPPTTGSVGLPYLFSQKRSFPYQSLEY